MIDHCPPEIVDQYHEHYYIEHCLMCSCELISLIVKRSLCTYGRHRECLLCRVGYASTLQDQEYIENQTHCRLKSCMHHGTFRLKGQKNLSRKKAEATLHIARQDVLAIFKMGMLSGSLRRNRSQDAGRLAGVLAQCSALSRLDLGYLSYWS